MTENSLSERMTAALARIEAAMQRIDAGKTAPGLPFGAADGEDPELRARYEALQAEAGAALEQIEQVLSTLENGDAV